MSPEAETALDFLNAAGKWSSFVPLAVGVFYWKKLDNALRLLFVLAIASIISDNLDSLPDSIRMYCSRIFTVVEFTLISWFFIAQMTRRITKRIIIGLNIGFIIVAGIDLSLQGAMMSDNFSMGIEAIIFLVYSLVVLYFILKDMVYPNILATPQFWAVSAILLYFGGNIFLFVSVNYLTEESLDMFGVMWDLIHASLLIVYNLLISFAFWKARLEYR